MQLSEIIAKLRDVKVESFIERDIFLVTEDSRCACRDSIYVAIKGSKYNGADFINDARARGAKVFVCEGNYFVSNGETLIISKNARKTLAEISKIIFGDYVERMQIIGITGTKGKTTTAKILSECIASSGEKLVSVGTLGIEFYGVNVKADTSKNTTPSAPILYKTLDRAYKMGIRIAVIEVSSQALAEYRVFGIPFTVCIFTNISEDHVGVYEHRSFEEYLDAKRMLFSLYKPKCAIVNALDPLWEKITEGCNRVIKVGGNGADCPYRLLSDDDTRVDFSVDGESFSLSFGGGYNGLNAALAIITASAVTERSIAYFKDTVSKIKVSGRYEAYLLNGIKIIIDFAHNKKSFSAICENARKNSQGKLIVLFGSVGERSQSRRGELAAVAEKYADLSVITSDNPGRESAERIALEIYSHYSDKSKAKIITDRERAVYYSLSVAKSGDSILLLGKGQESYQLVGNEKIPFSEREIIKKLGAKALTT
ncbi:MAG: UDP-N-acetylmuramyl-tripeptide synthetase [Clostridia bacterium]|nr:UDP-N-acetylmuramyl-tripeptide synthetase [Clostridia bacterium]